MAVEISRQGLHRFFHHPDPFAGQIVPPSLVERGHCLVEQIINGLAFNLVLVIGILVLLSAPDGPPQPG